MPEHGFYELLRRPFPPPPPVGSPGHHHSPVDQQARGSLPEMPEEWGGDARKERGNGQSTPHPSVLVQEGSRKFRPLQKGGAFSKICQDSSHGPFPFFKNLVTTPFPLSRPHFLCYNKNRPLPLEGSGRPRGWRLSRWGLFVAAGAGGTVAAGALGTLADARDTAIAARGGVHSSGERSGRANEKSHCGQGQQDLFFHDSK